jgi:beta-galactosidase
MKTAQYLFTATLALFVTLFSNNSQAADARLTENFDSDWSFLKADASGAEQSNLTIPRGASWMCRTIGALKGRFRKRTRPAARARFCPAASAGIANILRCRIIPDKCVFIEFDGVMQNSDVWINGVLLGHRPYGYVSFSYELTGHLEFRRRQRHRGSRGHIGAAGVAFYAGAGIYRHVRLVVTDPVHIPQWGVFVTTPQVSAARRRCRLKRPSQMNLARLTRISFKPLWFRRTETSVATSERIATVGNAGKPRVLTRNKSPSRSATLEPRRFA